MSASRLALFFENGLADLPESGDIAVFGAGAESDLSMLPKDRLRLVCRMKPDVDALTRAGFEVAVAAPVASDTRQASVRAVRRMRFIAVLAVIAVLTVMAVSLR